MVKIEIWSDVMCPFCYIGKRRLENALEQSGYKSHVVVEWKSFQLNPDLQTDPSKSTTQYLAEIKGWTLEYAQQANQYVTNMAKEAGLEYHLEKTIVANSFNAHRLLQLAKEHHKGDVLEELLFHSYFTLGKNIDDKKVLVEIGTSAGLAETEILSLLESNVYGDKVEQDIYESHQMGVRGVPFFVFDRAFAVSGAQPVDVFIKALNKAFEGKDISAITTEGNTCDTGGNCN